ncbi:CNNM domain-containing protein [Salinibacillus aidingensis]|uniref:CNNM domain-containing protein n=1 Tax=Salinibacillus aidingensis TaxID=237684 RepID=A0ABP3L1H8_9BACI
MLIAIILLILTSLFLSGSETALTAVNKMKVKSRAENDDVKSKKLYKLISHPDELLTGILIGNNIANIALPTLVTMLALDIGINVGLATGILTVVIIIFAEVIPKSIAATFSDKIAYMVAPVIALILTILKPFTFVLSKLTGLLIKILSRGEKQEASFSREEFKTMMDIASNEGTLENEESYRIKGVIDFYSKDVRDALKTPRMEIVGISSDSTFEETRDILLNHNHTRYPVYQDTMDNIVGVFHSKQFLGWALSEQNQTLADFTDNQPLFVAETTSIEKVFKMMQKKKRHLAIVIDEYGGTTGIITHEDIIEAMLGQEIEDETDDDEEILIDELTDSHMICSGKLVISRLNDVFQTRIPEEEDILAGFLYKEFGHIPSEGEVLEFQHLEFEVLEMEDNKIHKVKISKNIV